MSERKRLIKWLGCKYNCVDRNKCLEEQADYLLENDVIIPPVKFDDTIYMIVEKRAKITREYFRFIKKTKLTFSNLERVLKYWGKTVFLTKEQAEKALKGGAE